jgi:hypothetical protein
MAEEKDQVSEATEPSKSDSDSAVLYHGPAYASAPWAARIVFSVIFAVCVFGAISLQRNRSDEINKNPLYIDDMFMPQAKYAKPLSLGYNHLMADFLYLRGIQAFGAQFKIASNSSTSTIAFFDTLTELDPYFQSAYKFGSMVLSQGDNHEAAIRLNAKGHYAQPEDYYLAYLNTYVANWNLDNPGYAKVWLRKSLAADNAPQWLERWEPWLDTKTGRYDIAVEGRIRNYLNTYDDPSREAEVYITLENMKRTINEWNISILHDAVRAYHEDKGEYPGNFEELLSGGDYLENYRGCDYRRLMYAFGQLPEGDYDKDAKALEIQAFAVLDLSGVPTSPYDDLTTPQAEDYYVIRQDVPQQYFDQAVNQNVYVKRLDDLESAVESQLKGLRARRLPSYFKEHGRYPESLEALTDAQKSSSTLGPSVDAAGNPWNYNAETGDVHSTSFPDL